MPKAKVRYFNMGPWPYFVGFTTDIDAFAREMRRLKIPEPPRAINAKANATTHFLTNGSTECAIIVMPRPTRQHSRECYASLLAHEAVHVVQEMRSKLGDLGSEAEAYIAQQIVMEGLQIAWSTGRVRRTEPSS